MPGCGASGASRVRPAQHAERAAHLLERGLARPLDRLQRLARALGVAVEHALRALGVHDHHPDAVRDDVVQLARDPRALLATATRSRWRCSRSSSAIRCERARTLRPTSQGVATIRPAGEQEALDVAARWRSRWSTARRCRRAAPTSAAPLLGVRAERVERDALPRAATRTAAARPRTGRRRGSRSGRRSRRRRTATASGARRRAASGSVRSRPPTTLTSSPPGWSPSASWSCSAIASASASSPSSSRVSSRRRTSVHARRR